MELSVLELVEVHVDETEESARRVGGDDIHTQRVSVELAWKRLAEDLPDQELWFFVGPIASPLRFQIGGETCAGQQNHGRERYSLKRFGVLSVGREEPITHSLVTQKCVAGLERNFLEKDNQNLSGETLQHPLRLPGGR